MSLNLSPTDTITGSPIATNGPPSGATPSGWFASPTLSLGPAQLWAYGKGGNFALGGVGMRLWYYDPDNANWVRFPTDLALTTEKQLEFLPFQFAPTAKLYWEITVNNPGATLIAFGFGIAPLGV